MTANDGNIRQNYTHTLESADSRENHFHALALPALIYAILTTIFLYKNFSGITLPLYVITAVGFILTDVKRLGRTAKKGWILYGVGMLLLALGICRTGNDEMIVYGHLMIFILTVGMVLYLFCREEHWTPLKHVSAFFTIGLEMIAAIGDFFSDAFTVLRNSKSQKSRNMIYVVIGILILIPLSAVILALLASADAVFGQIMDRLFTNILVDGNFILVPCFFLGAFAVSYCGLRAADKGRIPEEVKDHRNAPTLVACTVLIPLTAIYLIFSGIQIFSLFLGKMQLPAHYTYAEYAREGFFQLLAVCMINVCLVLAVQGLFRSNKLIRILLTLVSACTYIMLASSALRLYLYIRVYHLSMLRIEVIWALAVIAICMALVMITVFRPHFPLMRSALGVVTAALILLIWVQPDAVIARYNLSHITEETDYDYLSTLSTDAAPYIRGQEGYLVDSYALGLSYDDSDSSPLQFNISRSRARDLFREEIAYNKEEIAFYLFNYTDEDISDVSWTLMRKGSYVISGEAYNGDGSDIVYPGDALDREDACQVEFNRYDLQSVLKDDGSLPDDLTLEFTWTCDGVETTVCRKLGSCEWGESRDLYLSEDADGNYQIDE